MLNVGTEGTAAVLAIVLAFFCANGEASASSVVTPCQAAVGEGAAEGVETRGPSPNSNDLQERPAPYQPEGEEIVRHSEETLRAVINGQRNRCKNVTWEMDEIKLFKTIPKVPASNTVEEFNRLLSYSEGGATAFDLGWMTEGDLPEEQDSTYERAVVNSKAA